MKQKLFACLTAALLLTAPLPVFAEEDAAPSGTYHGLDWRLEDHLLTISGKGEIVCEPDAFPDNDSTEFPDWKPYADDIYEIVIGEGVTGAQKHALAEYPNLQKITLPSTFQSLAPYALNGDEKLSEIVGLEYVTDYNFSCLSGTAYIAEHPCIVTDGRLYYAECAGTDLTVPDGVTEIMPFAFGNLTSADYLKSEQGALAVTVHLPESVEIIHDSAFAFCAGLRSVDLPENLREIGDHAFFDCANLAPLTLGEHVESVGEQAFYNCRSLQTLTVQSPDTVLGEQAYGLCYDWEKILQARRGTDLSEKDYERMLYQLQQDPCGLDAEMAYFAVHFFDTKPYSAIHFQNGYEDYLKRQGTVAGWRFSTAQTFASGNALRFEALDAEPGDVNLDGIIDILDVIALNKFLLGMTDLRTASRAAADYNGDGRTEPDDSLAILHRILEIQKNT